MRICWGLRSFCCRPTGRDISRRSGRNWPRWVVKTALPSAAARNRTRCGSQQRLRRVGYAITRDRHLNSRPAEKEAIIRHRARVIRLDARHQLNKWLELETVVCQWRRSEELLESDGPWVDLASRTAVTRLKL